MELTQVKFRKDNSYDKKDTQKVLVILLAKKIQNELDQFKNDQFKKEDFEITVLDNGFIEGSVKYKNKRVYTMIPVLDVQKFIDSKKYKSVIDSIIESTEYI